MEIAEKTKTQFEVWWARHEKSVSDHSLPLSIKAIAWAAWQAGYVAGSNE